jgi:hypothetical protein
LNAHKKTHSHRCQAEGCEEVFSSFNLLRTHFAHTHKQGSQILFLFSLCSLFANGIFFHWFMDACVRQRSRGNQGWQWGILMAQIKNMIVCQKRVRVGAGQCCK